MGERDDARHQVEQARARMTAVAHEVSRRMSGDYAKERVGEMARERVMQARDRAVDNPWLVPLIGAGIGALVGRAIVSRAEDAREREWDRLDRDYRRRWYYGESAGLAARDEDVGYGTYGESWRDETVGAAGTPRERVAEAASDLKDRAAGAASEVRERVGEKAGEYRARMREGAHAFRERMPDAETIRASAREQPGLWALGAMALGALFGFAVPVSDRERRVLEPARERLREAGAQAADAAMSRAEGAVEAAERRVDEGEQRRDPQIAPAGTVLPSPMDPLH